MKDLATQSALRETGLRLQLGIKEVESRLQLEIRAVEVQLVSTIHRQTVWVIWAAGAILGILRFLDVVLK